MSAADCVTAPMVGAAWSWRDSRSSLRLLAQLVGLYFVVLFVLSFSQADRVLWGWGLLPLPPTVLFLALAAPLLVVLVVEAVSRPEMAAALGATLTRNFAFAAPLLLLSAANLLAALRPAAHWDEAASFLLLVPYDCLVFVIGVFLAALSPVRRALPMAATGAILLMAATVAIDVVSPGQFSRVISRAAGVARDPNVAAFLITLALTFCLRFGSLRRRDLALLAVAAAAIIATLSRQGLLLYGLLVATYAYQAATEGGRKRFDLKGLLPVGLAVGVMLTGLVSLVLLSRTESGIFSIYASGGRLDLWTGESDWLEGRMERLDLLRLFAEQVLLAPVLGHGTGFTYTFEQGPHNRYLQEWVNAGLPGLLAYAGWFVAGWMLFRGRRYLPGTLAVVLVAADSFFAHGILEQRGVPLALGLLSTLSLFVAEPARKLSEGAA